MGFWGVFERCAKAQLSKRRQVNTGKSLNAFLREGNLIHRNRNRTCRLGKPSWWASLVSRIVWGSAHEPKIPGQKHIMSSFLRTDQSLQKIGGLGVLALFATLLAAPAGKGEGEREAGNLYGLCVGVNDYSGLKGYISPTPPKSVSQGALDLNAPRRDAMALREMLLRQQGLYKTTQVTLLLDKQATAEAILSMMEALEKKVTRQDQFVLFLAGHGYAKPLDDEGSLYDPKTWYFVCSDTDRRQENTRLDVKRLWKALARLRCRRAVFVDTPHSGCLVKQLDPQSVLVPNKLPVIQVFASCDIHQFGLEDPDGHGVFTASLLAAVKAPGVQTDRNGDGLIDARELADYLRADVPRRWKELAVRLKVSDEGGGPQQAVIYPDPLIRTPLFRQQAEPEPDRPGKTSPSRRKDGG